MSVERSKVTSCEKKLFYWHMVHDWPWNISSFDLCAHRDIFEGNPKAEHKFQVIQQELRDSTPLLVNS